VTTIVKAISASPAMMTKPRRDDRRESASSQGAPTDPIGLVSDDGVLASQIICSAEGRSLRRRSGSKRQVAMAQDYAGRADKSEADWTMAMPTMIAPRALRAIANHIGRSTGAVVLRVAG
jgi:hypothetical protein